MANLTKLKSDTLGSIAAVQTILERYPVLLSTNSLASITGLTTSFNFMFDILQIIGVDNTMLVEWAANLLTGDGESGILDKIEKVVKFALKLNVKNLLSCTINPIIPDDLLDYHKVKDKFGDNMPSGIYTEGSGIEINLGAIDFTGVLKTSPTSEIGKYYYFDNEKLPNNLYESRDFNAFVWYVINKGLMTEQGKEKYKMRWDNRNKIKIKDKDIDEQNLFYQALTTEDVNAYNETNSPKKKQIIQCQFVERSFPNNNRLKVQLCSDTYYKTRKLLSTDNGDLLINKTIFEFNNDYIDSLKLFNSKVLMAQIVDKLTGVLAVNVGYSINETVVQGKVDNIIKKIIEGDDTNISDCYYTFTNEDYDTLLQDAALKHANLYKYSGDTDNGVIINADDLLNSLTGITENSTLQENVTTIKNTFTDVSATLAQDGSVTVSDSFTFGLDIIFKMIQQIMYAIISAILSPKVMILLAINSHIMGNEFPASIEEILEGLTNLIVTIIKEIKDLILNELYNFLMSLLTPLFELFATKISLESIEYYKELITDLIEACSLNWGGSAQSVIDNVNYADIVPQETTPEENIC